MSAQVLDGKEIATRVRAEVAGRVKALRAAGVVPRLSVILAGDDPASATYVRNKAKFAEQIGIDSEALRYPADVDAATLRDKVAALNADPAVHGILVQLPLPAGIAAADAQAVLDLVSPEKDVDGFHPVNLGHLVAGQPRFVPCTPAGCMRLIREAGVDPAGKRAVVIGRSLIVGKPMSMLLLGAHATVTTCHSRTKDLPAVVREGDIVIAAVGKAELVRADWIKPGACVIDVGINRDAQGKLVGDVAFDEVAQVAGAITPVPGGVGPLTIAFLLANVCTAAERRLAGE